MINLPKPKKVKEGQTKAADLRPISVYSVIWRQVAGPWLRSEGMLETVQHLLKTEDETRKLEQ